VRILTDIFLLSFRGLSFYHLPRPSIYIIIVADTLPACLLRTEIYVVSRPDRGWRE